MKRLKRTLAVILAAALICSLSGCGGSTASSSAAAGSTAASSTAASSAAASSKASSSTAASEKKNIKLASHNAVIEGNSYRVVYEENIQEAAKAAADKGLNVSYNSFVSNWDAATEQQQLENSINEGYDIILINPVAATGLDAVIDKALAAGIIYVNCDCEYYSNKILNICTDQYYLGYKCATEAGKVLGKGAKVIMIAAIAGNAANEQRQAGFLKGCEEQGLQIVATYNHDWDTVKCQQIMTEVLNSGIEFDGVLVSQDASAVLNAYEAAGKPYPKFVGFGDDGDFMQRMLKIDATSDVLPYVVISNPPGVGATALNFALNLYEGKTLKDNIYSNKDYNSIYIESKVWYNYDNQNDYKSMAESMKPTDAITYWLTMDEVANTYFK